jgi:CDP-6-deoxy-D-xylo-4-hexulose-3-dehydrase
MNINLPIKLVKDTISKKEIDLLCDWLKTYPQLTKGKLTEEFEQKWSNWLGMKYSIFLNSGSSANLAMIYALKESNRLKNKKIVAPCVSWVTTVSPIIQFGFDLLLCDTDRDTLGVDTIHLEHLFKTESPSVLILVHVLGIPNKMKEIIDLCEKYDVILLEDSCESVGSCYDGKKTGTFGLMSSFSTYFGHHFSTIEGGLISTNDFEMYELIKSIRSHGWSRDLSPETQTKLKLQNNIDDFRNFYTFYYPGFNLRSTDLQAFLGINQLNELTEKTIVRHNNLIKYDSLIKNPYWKYKIDEFNSNFAYPVISPKKDKIVFNLQKGGVECRPLVCGSMSLQPFYIKKYGYQKFNFAEIVHNYGLYLPNNSEMTEEEICYICNIVNRSIEDE